MFLITSSKLYNGDFANVPGLDLTALFVKGVPVPTLYGLTNLFSLVSALGSFDIPNISAI